jgi:hypothetical protein
MTASSPCCVNVQPAAGGGRIGIMEDHPFIIYVLFFSGIYCVNPRRFEDRPRHNRSAWEFEPARHDPETTWCRPDSCQKKSSRHQW